MFKVHHSEGWFGALSGWCAEWQSGAPASSGTVVTESMTWQPEVVLLLFGELPQVDLPKSQIQDLNSGGHDAKHSFYFQNHQ